jgi:hypothetical protein
VEADGMSEYLNNQDLHQLTGYARAGKQAEWLKSSGIPHRVDGMRIIVAHSHVKSWLEGQSVTIGQINFGAVK